jgi:hypothetical protein
MVDLALLIIKVNLFKGFHVSSTTVQALSSAHYTAHLARDVALFESCQLLGES